MSRDEVKREHKESEGEPAHKAERLRLHQEFMQEQASGDVTEADFVVVQSGVMAGVMVGLMVGLMAAAVWCGSRPWAKREIRNR